MHECSRSQVELLPDAALTRDPATPRSKTGPFTLGAFGQEKDRSSTQKLGCFPAQPKQDTPPKRKGGGVSFRAVEL